jgi:hypothetical protein
MKNGEIHTGENGLKKKRRQIIETRTGWREIRGLFQVIFT